MTDTERGGSEIKDEIAEVLWMHSDDNDDNGLEWENNHARRQWLHMAQGVLDHFHVTPRDDLGGVL